MPVELHHGDCMDVLSAMPDNSIDSVVTDPPYGISFMGRVWDHLVPSVALWKEVIRVLKPGGHLLSFGGTRTYHRMVVNIEDVGFEIRDQIGYCFGTGFPKSLDISKQLDRQAGAVRKIVGRYQPPNGTTWNLSADVAKSEIGATGHSNRAASLDITAPATPEAAQWQGWGTALKPAWEPICVARKPLAGTVAQNVLRHRVGGLNIDACRVEGVKPLMGDRTATIVAPRSMTGASTGRTSTCETTTEGRWPANLLHDGSDEVLEAFAAYGERGGGFGKRGSGPKAREGYSSSDNVPGAQPMSRLGLTGEVVGFGDTGTAARFFYCAKASKADRAGSKHPTVKPLSLMQWLCRLVTPPGGTVLDPFAGSGTTGQAAVMEGFNAILIEKEAEYCADIRRRLGLGDFQLTAAAD